MTLRAYPNSHLKSAKKDEYLAGNFFLHSRHTQLNLSTTRARCHCIFSVVRHSVLGHFCSLAMRPFFLSHSHRSPSRPAASNGSTVVSKKFGSLQTPGMMDRKRLIYVRDINIRVMEGGSSMYMLLIMNAIIVIKHTGPIDNRVPTTISRTYYIQSTCIAHTRTNILTLLKRSHTSSRFRHDLLQLYR